MTLTHLSNQDIQELISAKQKKIIKSTRMGMKHNFNLMQDCTKELVSNIAHYYYPNSKHPELEITFIEALDMNEKVIKRLRNIFDIKGISILKQVRISQILHILEVKRTIEKNPVYQFSKKYNLNKVVSVGIAALNIANPAYWIRRIIFTSTLESSLRAIGVMTLNIVGEEANTLYSKKIIDNRDTIIEKELEKFIKEIETAKM